MYTSLMLRSQG